MYTLEIITLTWDISLVYLHILILSRDLTVVVKFTQSLTKVSGVLPVTSSHWARVVPPKRDI